MDLLLDSVLGAIGKTPLVALDRLRVAEGVEPRILAKLEYFSPGASVKDRAALRMLEEAEKSGALLPGQTVIELTSGNMGIGLAVACAVKGYRFTAVMSRGNSRERWRVMKALGAKVVLVPQAKGGVPGKVTGEDLARVEKKAQELARRDGAFRVDQFKNPANPAAHRDGTGEEIWDQSEGKVDNFVAIAGTGGTFVGVSSALKKHNPNIGCFVVEPAGAPVLAGGRVTSPRHKIQGTGYALVPEIWDPSLCDGYLTVTDAEAVRTARLLASREGILAGFSGGANVAASMKLARKLSGEKTVVTIVPDTGLKYLSTDLFP
ncbi:MAG: cysteine synthase family protein [Thaumarchaeota archaeon]|nr:cysteine synthase family protein [Nitrososphaerota archaeon]